MDTQTRGQTDRLIPETPENIYFEGGIKRKGNKYVLMMKNNECWYLTEYLLRVSQYYITAV